ncbi:Uncharacterised protein [Mycolicibacterium vanbaalenii]|uniref:Uncharacterized protein n=1 Tax=Mycolicibacterium vanbaalenii TaxID=110539 RepID=A0A5S9RBU7_MYCVN|nr:Uncharacterised protein [Mycolicibacterium vanbaalenii]
MISMSGLRINAHSGSHTANNFDFPVLGGHDTTSRCSACVTDRTAKSLSSLIVGVTRNFGSRNAASAAGDPGLRCSLAAATARAAHNTRTGSTIRSVSVAGDHTASCTSRKCAAIAGAGDSPRDNTSQKHPSTGH